MRNAATASEVVNKLRRNGFVVVPKAFAGSESAIFRELLDKYHERIAGSGECERDAKYPDLTMISATC